MESHLVYGGKMLYTTGLFGIGDRVYVVSPISFWKKIPEAYERMKAYPPHKKTRVGDYFLILKLLDAHVWKGEHLAIFFDEFQDFEEHLNFDKFYPVGVYDIRNIEGIFIQTDLQRFYESKTL